MKRSIINTLILSACIASAPSYALLNFGNSDSTDSITNALNSALNQVQSNTQLTSQLTEQLDVTPTQAAGGAGALLALAQNQLGEENNQELGQLFPGIDQLTSLNLGGDSNLLASVDSLSQVNKVFTELGLDPALIGQFTPIVLQYLGQQNASSELISSLSSLWGN